MADAGARGWLDGLRRRVAPGRVAKLTAEQRAHLPGRLAWGAQAWGFAGEVWTTPRVAAVIEQACGVRSHPAHVSRLLRAIGWSPQQPIQRATQRHEHVHDLIDEVHPDLLLVFDTGGITGHPDHCRATEAAIAAAVDLPVLAWVLAEAVALHLKAEFGIPFVGRRAEEIDLMVELDRHAQREAIRCHRSQSLDNPVLWRRLELQGNLEAFRWLRPMRTLSPSST